MMDGLNIKRMRNPMSIALGSPSFSGAKVGFFHDVAKRLPD